MRRIQAAPDDQLLINSEEIAIMNQKSQDKLSDLVARLERQLEEKAEALESALYQQVETAMENAIQEIHDCADDATDKFN